MRLVRIRLVCILIASSALAQTPPPPVAPAKDTFQSSMEKQRASVAVQREATRKQSEMAAQWRSTAALTSSAYPATSETQAAETAGTECDPIPDVELAPMIDAAAQSHQLQVKLLRGVIRQESGFKPCAVSAKGAKGLMQLMPATIDQFQVSDPFDAQQNIEAGATFLKQLLDKYKGDIALALSAYNSGPGTVDQAGRIPDIKETRDYVDAIMKQMKPPQ
jgi:soluble lytic murein transglycosylase-like protein